MHKLLIFALVGASCHVSVSANAASSTQDQSPDRMVCKRYKQTGTRFENKVCKPASEWEAIAEARVQEAEPVFLAAAANGSRY